MDRYSMLSNRTRDGLEQARVQAPSVGVAVPCSVGGHVIPGAPFTTGVANRWGMAIKCSTRLLGSPT